MPSIFYKKKKKSDGNKNYLHFLLCSYLHQKLGNIMRKIFLLVSGKLLRKKRPEICFQAFHCGGGGNRTRVRERADKNLYIRSLLISVACKPSTNKGIYKSIR